MAVQAPYPSSIAFTIPDFHKPGAGAGAGAILGDHHLLAGNPALLLPQQLLLKNPVGTTVFSEPDSDLTCNNAYASRKRPRPDETAANLPQLQHRLHVSPSPLIQKLSNCNDHRRLNESDMTSTSGRPPAGAAAATSPSPANISPLAREVVSQIYQHSLEIDALIRFQNEKLRSGLEESRKRHCRALLSAVEEQVLRRIHEKEAELGTVNRRNAELEAKIRQIGAENLIWFNAARNNEALVANLRATLDQVLLQNAAGNGGEIALAAAVLKVDEEGCGDSDGGAAVFPPDDAESCCFDDSAEREERLRRRRACKVCIQEEVSVLLLPCRHLCLCRSCESRLDACPICKSPKNASLQVFLS